MEYKIINEKDNNLNYKLGIGNYILIGNITANNAGHQFLDDNNYSNLYRSFNPRIFIYKNIYFPKFAVNVIIFIIITHSIHITY